VSKTIAMAEKIFSNKYLVFAVRLILGVVFIYASLEKIQNPAGFAQAIYNYRMVPVPLINMMAVLLPWLELLCGVLIIVGVFVRGSALLIGAMLAVFIVALSSALLRGLDISCGCFTLEGGRGIAGKTLVEDVLLMGCVVIAFLFGGKAFSFKKGLN
jgi:putative oxidoreductase